MAVAVTAPVSLGSAANFAVLAGSTITNTGPTAITGNVGLSPGTAVTGFLAGLLDGTVHADDGVASQAKTDLAGAYDDAADGRPQPPSRSSSAAPPRHPGCTTRRRARSGSPAP